MSGARSPRRATLAVATAVLAVLGGLLVYNLLKPRPYYTGTNSVVGKNVAAELPSGSRLCVPEVQLPARTGGIRLEARPQRPGDVVRVEARVEPRTGKALRTGTPVLGRERASVDMPIPTQPARPVSALTELCLTARGGGVLLYGLVGIQSDERLPTLDGRNTPARIALWFLPPAGQQRSLLAQFPDIARRAAILRPGFVGAWTYWVLAFAVLPALLAAGSWLGYRSLTGRAPRRAAVLVAGLVFVNAGAWALITPTFDGPDEQDHAAYAQYLAETGKRPSPAVEQQRSSEEVAAVDATRLIGHNEDPRGRPPWLPADEARWRGALTRETEPTRDNGGGISTAATHAPLYYGLTVPAYWVASGDSVFGRVFAMRLTTALLGALTALFALLAIRELLPGHEGLAVAAGLVVGFQPMVGFMSGVVNNDMAVNATCAALVWLVLRGLRRGLSVRLALAIGLVVALAPLMKFTGYFLYPAAALGVAGMLWRVRERSTLVALATLLATAVAVRVVWLAVSGAFDPAAAAGVAALPGGASLGGSQLDLVRADPAGFASYVWQVFVPFKLPFMTDLYGPSWPAYDIFGVRGWAAFGWYAIVFPSWVYDVIFTAMLCLGALAIVALVRFRDAARRRWIELLVLLAAIVTVVVGLEMAFFKPSFRPAIAEQGRYVFTALVPLVALATGACLAVGRAWSPVLAASLVTATLVLSTASQLLTLSTFYT